MIDTDIIVSINVHENPEYLITQLENIKRYLNLKHKVILNCNDSMFSILKNKNIDAIINPEVINKKRFHGSITKGIYSNMKMSINIFKFDIFLILSSRTFFYNEINSIQDIKKLSINSGLGYGSKKSNYYDFESKINWMSPLFKSTILFDFISKNNMYFSSSPHEGLCFTEKSCIDIIDFLEKNLHIKEDLFNYNTCVEEFALQTICCNNHDYYNIGNGTSVLSIDKCSPNKFTYKKVR